MDWLEAHRAVIDCRRKWMKCVNDSGSEVEVVGIQRPISLGMISAMQLKSCQLFVVIVNDLELGESQEEVSLDSHPILRQYADVFPSEIPGMPPKHDIDFQIDLVPRVEPISRAPYRMTT